MVYISILFNMFKMFTRRGQWSAGGLFSHILFDMFKMFTSRGGWFILVYFSIFVSHQEENHRIWYIMN